MGIFKNQSLHNIFINRKVYVISEGKEREKDGCFLKEEACSLDARYLNISDSVLFTGKSWSE